MLLCMKCVRKTQNIFRFETTLQYGSFHSEVLFRGGYLERTDILKLQMKEPFKINQFTRMHWTEREQMQFFTSTRSGVK